MKELTKQHYFNEGDSTSLKEIEELSKELLATTWLIDIYRYKSALLINLADRGWTFEFNDRKRAAGLCNNNNKTIYISKWLLKQNLDQALEFENTIRHEIAHAIDYEMRGTSDHSRIWKAVAREVLCTAERCYKGSVIQTKVTTKYTLICDVCGKKSASHRVKKRKTACGTCCREYNGGRYSEKYALRQVQNY